MSTRGIGGFLFTSLGLTLIAFTGGCGSPNLAQRIDSDRELFEEWPAEVRQAVEEGRIDVGFSREQVRVAWGEPDNIAMETLPDGRFERWIYERSSPGISIGLGAGSFGRSSGVSGGVGTTVGGRTNILKVVRFQEGVVDSFEEAAE